jgi:hypothetical protein
VVVGVAMREDNGAHVGDVEVHDVEVHDVEVVPHGVRREPRVVEDRLRFPVAGDADQGREAMLRQQLVPLKPVVGERKAPDPPPGRPGAGPSRDPSRS